MKAQAKVARLCVTVIAIEAQIQFSPQQQTEALYPMSIEHN